MSAFSHTATRIAAMVRDFADRDDKRLDLAE
jgi:hypothetical protein